MKRAFIVILALPILLLMLLNACTPAGGTEIPAYVWTYMAQTVVAASWTPTPTVPPTSTPNVPTILSLLNNQPTDPFTVRLGQLENAISVRYEVGNVEFLPAQGETTIFQVDIRCQCARNEQCCSREQGFLYALWKMQPYAIYLSTEVPQTVKYLNVVTYVQSAPLPPVSADWINVKNFLNVQAPVDGNQFGAQVTVAPAP